MANGNFFRIFLCSIEIFFCISISLNTQTMSFMYNSELAPKSMYCTYGFAPVSKIVQRKSHQD